MLVRSMYEMNTAAEQRKTTECHDLQPERITLAGAGVTPAADPAGTVRSDMDAACGLEWYNPARLGNEQVDNMPTPDCPVQQAHRNADAATANCVARRLAHTSHGDAPHKGTNNTFDVSGRRVGSMPETMSPGYAAAEREAYRSVRRACDAALDSMALRVELARRITRLIPTEASYFGTFHPRSASLDDVVAEDAFDEIERDFLEAAYGVADMEHVVDLARSGRVADTRSSTTMMEWMRGAGLGRALRAAFALGDEPSGVFLALRERRSRAFGEHDVAFMRRVAPHIARALRRAALLDAARVTRLADVVPNETEPAALSPGVVVIDDRWRITQWTPAAEAQIADLADATDATAAPTSAIVDFVRRQRAPGDARGVNFLSVQGRSGRWYTLRAALSEPDELGRSSTVVIITPARSSHRVA